MTVALHTPVGAALKQVASTVSQSSSSLAPASPPQRATSVSDSFSEFTLTPPSAFPPAYETVLRTSCFRGRRDALANPTVWDRFQALRTATAHAFATPAVDSKSSTLAETLADADRVIEYLQALMQDQFVAMEEFHSDVAHVQERLRCIHSKVEASTSESPISNEECWLEEARTTGIPAPPLRQSIVESKHSPSETVTQLSISEGVTLGFPGNTFTNEGDEEGFNRVCLLLNSLLQDASTAVDSEVDRSSLQDWCGSVEHNVPGFPLFQQRLSAGHYSTPRREVAHHSATEGSAEMSIVQKSCRLLENEKSELVELHEEGRYATRSLACPVWADKAESAKGFWDLLVKLLAVCGSCLSGKDQMDCEAVSSSRPAFLCEAILIGRRHLRRTTAAVDPVLEKFLSRECSACPKSMEMAALSLPDIEQRRPIANAVSSTLRQPDLAALLRSMDSAVGDSARVAVYVTCWTFVFVLATCLADAELLGRAAFKVQRAVAGDLRMQTSVHPPVTPETHCVLAKPAELATELADLCKENRRQ